MKKLTICVPDEMAALVREWKKWIPEMTIIQEETVVDQTKRIKVKRDKEEKPNNTAYSGDTRSPIPVISVHSFGNLQYRRQS